MNWTLSIANRETWEHAAASLQRGEQSLLSLWGEPGRAHLALIESNKISLLHLDCAAGAFPSVGRLHPPAIRLERAMRDLAGLHAEGAPDTRPWLRHAGAYPFLPAEGESLHQIPVGPVHAGIIEPGHFRFTANGETVVRLEERLGYVHKGIDTLMAGASLERAATLAGRVSGDSTVAYAIAFSQAVENALGAPAPRARCGCARSRPSSSGSPTTSATSARSATTPRSASCTRAAACCASTCCARQRLLRPSIDDGRGGSGRPARRPRAGRRARARGAARLHPPALSPSSSTCTTTPPRSRTAPSAPESFRRRSRSSMPPAAMSGARRAATSMRGARRAMRRTTTLQFEVPVGAGGRRQRTRVDPHPRSRAEPGVDRADPRSPAVRACSRRGYGAHRGKASPSSKASAATSSRGCASARTAVSSAATCAIRPGSSGRCSRRRSRATSSPTSRSAINPSTARIPAMTSDEIDAQQPRRAVR